MRTLFEIPIFTAAQQFALTDFEMSDALGDTSAVICRPITNRRTG